MILADGASSRPVIVQLLLKGLEIKLEHQGNEEFGFQMKDNII